MEERITPGWRTPDPSDIASLVTAKHIMRVSVGESVKTATNAAIRLNTAETGGFSQKTFNWKEPIKQPQKGSRRETEKQARKP